MFAGIKTKDKILIVYAISILLVMFNGAHAWFLWQVDDKLFMYVNLFISIWFMATHKNKWLKMDLISVAFLFFVITLYHNRANYNLLGMILR